MRSAMRRPQEDIDRVCAMYLAGEKYIVIRHELKISDQQIRKYLRLRNIPLRTKKPVPTFNKRGIKKGIKQ